MSVTAHGGGDASDIKVVGSDLQAGRDLTLTAEDDIELLAAQNRFKQESDNRGSSWGIGVGAEYGSNGFAMGITANASGSRGHTDGEDIRHTNTHVAAGNTLTIESGNDTTLKGAVASGKQVVANVGGDLNIESLQDTSTYESEQKSGGFALSLCIPPFCYGASSASVNYSQAEVEGDFASVNEQSGIRAGDEGFQINVEGNTDLKGAIIASTDKAVEDGRNRLTTGTLTANDIHNHDEYEASSGGFSAGVGGSFGAHPSVGGPPGASAGYSSESGKQSSVTKAGVSTGAVTITDDEKQQERTGQDAEATVASLNRDVSTDKDTSGALRKEWDGHQLMEQVQAEQQIVAAFGQHASKAIGDYAGQKQAALRAQAKQAHDNGDDVQAQALLAEAQQWAEGGAYRVALHTAVGGLTGNLEGAAGALASATIMGELGEAIDDMDLPGPVKQALGQITATAIGAAIAGASGASAALNVEANNRQLHPSEEKWLRDNAKKFAESEGISEKEAMERLSQQATREVDYVWRAQLADGDDAAAKAFLQTTSQTFINDLGEQQRLFTASGQQLLRPEMFADIADPAFYQQFVQSGISRNLNEGLLKEFKDSGIDIKDSIVQLAEVAKENPGLVLKATWEAISGLPGAIMDGFHETGNAIGEGAAVALDGDLTAKLNAIYGTDVATAQKALLAIRVTTAITGAAGTSKIGAHLGEATAKAVGKKLDEILDQKAWEALLKSGGAFDKNGQPLLDLKTLSDAQKGAMGELLGAHTVKQIVPDGEKLARIPGVGETGIDDLYRVNRSDVDYVVVEHKFVGSGTGKGSTRLGDTADGKQGSETWTLGGDRIEKAVGEKLAPDIEIALRSGRVETWVVTTRPDGSTIVEVLDTLGKPKPIDTSKILTGVNLSGAQP